MEDCNIKYWKPNIIVIGPGGINSYIELGSLLKLESENYLKNVNHFIGCSSGAVVALLIVAGYKISEIIEESLNTDILKDMSDIESIKEILEHNNLTNNNSIENCLRDKLVEKFAIDLTFQQLYMATGINLTIVTYNVDKERPEYLSKDTEPNLSCVTATIMSMSIPILMKRRMYKGFEYIDGSLGNPYPVDIHDNNENNILGIYIINDHKNTNKPISFIYKVAASSITQLRNRIIDNSTKKCKHLGLQVPLKEISDSLSDNRFKSMLIRSGYEKATSFIEELKHPEKYKILLDRDEEIPFQENIINFENSENVENFENSVPPLIDFYSSINSNNNNELQIPITPKSFPIIQQLNHKRNLFFD